MGRDVHSKVLALSGQLHRPDSANDRDRASCVRARAREPPNACANGSSSYDDRGHIRFILGHDRIEVRHTWLLNGRGTRRLVTPSATLSLQSETPFSCGTAFVVASQASNRHRHRRSCRPAAPAPSESIVVRQGATAQCSKLLRLPRARRMIFMG
jgi:hypothetical protein